MPKRRAYFVAMIGGVICMGRACDEQMPDAFQLSRSNGVSLWCVQSNVTELT